MSSTGLPEPLAALVSELKRLPGIGQKSAQRIAFHLLGADPARARTLGRAVSELHDRVRHCRRCGNFTAREVCGLCRNPERSQELICVVEQPGDIAAVEKARTYRGCYHVLMGTFSPLSGSGGDGLRIDSLLERIRRGGVREVVLATNPNHDGEATAAWLTARLRADPATREVRVTRIGIGVPMGSELAHADQVTMTEALAHRSEL